MFGKYTCIIFKHSKLKVSELKKPGKMFDKVEIISHNESKFCASSIESNNFLFILHFQFQVHTLHSKSHLTVIAVCTLFEGPYRRRSCIVNKGPKICIPL